MFDSHCHLDFDAFKPDLSHLLDEAHELGITDWLVPSIGLHRVDEQGAVANLAGVHLAAGIHPWWAMDVLDVDEDVALVQAHIEQYHAVAIGEVGLDAKRPGAADLEHQLAVFEAQLRLAIERDLPLVIHLVGAREEFLATLKRVGLPGAGAVMHGFTAEPQFAQALVERGISIGVGLAITRPQNERLADALRSVPAEFLLVETDGPDHAPWASHAVMAKKQHGAPDADAPDALAAPEASEASGDEHDEPSRGVPADLLTVVDRLAEIRGESRRAIAAQTDANARRLLAL